MLCTCSALCDPVACSSPGSSVHGISQVRILEWVTIPLSREMILRINTMLAWSEVKLLSRVWLCDPMNCSLPGSSVHGIFQARVLEWVAISFSRGSSRPRDRTRVSRIVGRCFTVWATREWIGPQPTQTLHEMAKIHLHWKGEERWRAWELPRRPARELEGTLQTKKGYGWAQAVSQPRASMRGCDHPGARWQTGCIYQHIGSTVYISTRRSNSIFASSSWAHS